MALADVLEILKSAGVVGLIVVLGSLIKVTPLQINIWDWLARKIGNALNHDTLDKIDNVQKKQAEIEKKLDDHIKENERDTILEVRRTILNFAREILCGTSHTREDFHEALSRIDRYNKYCEEHPDFPNSRAIFAIQLIQDNYKERLEKADFLEEGYRRAKAKQKQEEA